MRSTKAAPGARTATLTAYRSIPAILAVVCIGALSAACSPAAIDGPRDVGSMAYPEALPEGNLNSAVLAGRQPRDTGNMAYPDPVPAGVISRTTATRQAFDTGSMAYPTPLPAGNGPVTFLK